MGIHRNLRGHYSDDRATEYAQGRRSEERSTYYSLRLSTHYTSGHGWRAKSANGQGPESKPHHQFAVPHRASIRGQPILPLRRRFLVCVEDDEGGVSVHRSFAQIHL